MREYRKYVFVCQLNYDHDRQRTLCSVVNIDPNDEDKRDDPHRQLHDLDRGVTWPEARKQPHGTGGHRDPDHGHDQTCHLERGKDPEFGDEQKLCRCR